MSEPVTAETGRCSICAGILEQSEQYPDAGYLHADDTDDTHVPVLAGPDHPGIHKAAPGHNSRAAWCGTCGQPVRQVPGGRGLTWIHADSGAVAAPNPPVREVPPLPTEDQVLIVGALTDKARALRTRAATRKYAGDSQQAVASRAVLQSVAADCDQIAEMLCGQWNLVWKDAES